MDYLKRPVNQQINEAATKRAQDAINTLGYSLPCRVLSVVSPGTVKVAFEVSSSQFTLPSLEVPVQWSEYTRIPVQVGMRGLVQAASTRLGVVSGMPGGTPVLGERIGNLGGLSFVPIGSVNWGAADDANALVLYGPDGVILRDVAATNKVRVSGSGVNIDCTKIGFFGTAPITKETVTGLLSAVTDANAKAVLLSIITVLVAYGLITNGTT